MELDVRERGSAGPLLLKFLREDAGTNKILHVSEWHLNSAEQGQLKPGGGNRAVLKANHPGESQEHQNLSSKFNIPPAVKVHISMFILSSRKKAR